MDRWEDEVLHRQTQTTHLSGRSTRVKGDAFITNDIQVPVEVYTRKEEEHEDEGDGQRDDIVLPVEEIEESSVREVEPTTPILPRIQSKVHQMIN